MRKRTAILLFVSAAFAAPASALTDVISDSELVSRVAAIRASQEAPADRVVGMHKGYRVVVDVRCGDVCPANTVRIIRYDVAPGAACHSIGGDSARVVVPRGIGVFPQEFCVPHVLYSRNMHRDRPYQR